MRIWGGCEISARESYYMVYLARVASKSCDVARQEHSQDHVQTDRRLVSARSPYVG
jgi:hypothetical protein